MPTFETVFFRGFLFTTTIRMENLSISIEEEEQNIWKFQWCGDLIAIHIFEMSYNCGARLRGKSKNGGKWMQPLLRLQMCGSTDELIAKKHISVFRLFRESSLNSIYVLHRVYVCDFVKLLLLVRTPKSPANNLFPHFSCKPLELCVLRKVYSSCQEFSSVRCVVATWIFNLLFFCFEFIHTEFNFMWFVTFRYVNSLTSYNTLIDFKIIVCVRASVRAFVVRVFALTTLKQFRCGY